MSLAAVKAGVGCASPTRTRSPASLNRKSACAVRTLRLLHDVFQINLGSMRNILNFPGMPIAAIVTYTGMLQGVASVQLTIRYGDKDID